MYLRMVGSVCSVVSYKQVWCEFCVECSLTGEKTQRHKSSVVQCMIAGSIVTEVDLHHDDAYLSSNPMYTDFQAIAFSAQSVEL